MLISQESADLITNEISIIMHKPIFLADERAVILASTEPGRTGLFHPGAQAVMEQALEYHISDGLDGTARQEICFPITLNGRVVGAVGIVSDEAEVETLVAYYRDTIKRIAEVRIQRLSRRLSREEEQLFFERARRIFFESTLFSGSLADFLNDEEVVFRASLLGIDLVQPRVIVVLSFEPGAESGAEGATMSITRKQMGDFAKYMRQHINDNPQNFCFADEQHVVLLFCSTSVSEVEAASERLCKDLERFYSIRIFGGISSIAESPLQFQRCYTEAKMACNMAQNAQNKMLMVYDVVSPYFIAQSLAPEIRKALVTSVFGKASPEEVVEMANVIQTYCRNNGNVEQAAAEVYMHRNTFLYRMNKVKTLTGYSVKNPRDLFILYLAVLSMNR